MGTINDKIQNYIKSEERRMYDVGWKYYEGKNVKINDRKFQTAFGKPGKDENTFSSIKRVDSFWRANNKINSGYFPLLVDQKISYVLSKQIAYKDIPNGVEEYYNKKFQRDLKKCGRYAAAKGRGWVHVYLKDKQLNRQVMRPDNICPEFDDDDKLIALYRFWTEEYMKGKEKKDKYIVQEWTDKEVKVYEIKDNKETLTSEESHIREYIKYGSDVILQGEHGWGKIPFIKLDNNERGIYDLQRVKAFIDGVDLVSSDFVNNLEDFQDVYFVIKGYGGDNVEAFLKEVKQLKVIKIPSDGDAKTETIPIPYEARETFLKIADEHIFKAGMGLDMDKLAGGSLTNVAIQAKYANLDLKSNNFIEQIEGFLSEYAYFVDFISKEKYEPNPTFNKSSVINEVELLEANAKQRGNVPEKIRLANHPWIEDVDEAMIEMQNDFERSIGNYNTGGAK